MPLLIVVKAFFSLLSLLLLAAAVYLIWSWSDGYLATDAAGAVRHLRGPAWRLYAGVGLLGWSFLGRFIVLLLIPSKPTEPTEEREPSEMLTAADGSALHVERLGSCDRPTLVLTHGWGLNATAWSRTRRELGERFDLVLWDLPGLGRSKGPADGHYSLDRFAEALGAVVTQTSGRVVLVGHSIGGMTTQTLWRACTEDVKRKVAGLVLVDTTFEDPSQTMWLAPLWRALRVPVILPMMWLTIALWPLAWLSAWQGYLSGSSHIAMRLVGFGRFASRGEIDLSARLAAKGSPAVQAKGNLAMLRWSAADVLPTIDVPVLILTGAKDIITLPSASDVMARAIPNARVVHVEGCGHMGFMEKSDVYDREIAAFAERVLGAPTAV